MILCSISIFDSYIPAQEDGDEGEFSLSKKNHIPGIFFTTEYLEIGYQGYIPRVRPENMFGKTYGKLTYMALNGQTFPGNSPPTDERFKSIAQGSFVNQRDMLQSYDALHNLPAKAQVRQSHHESNIFFR